MKKEQNNFVFAINIKRNSYPGELFVFSSKAEAIAHCPGLEVAEGDWLFFANDGTPLKPVFSIPAQVKERTYTNGVYSLEANDDSSHLARSLLYLSKEHNGKFKTIENVSDHIRQAAMDYENTL